MELKIRTPEDLPGIAQQFAERIGTHRVFALRGAMGAGKTTFVRALCEALGTEDTVNSPTFAIVNEYRVPAAPQGIVYHFDLYRLQSEQEVRDIGAEDYLYSGALCFIEWPEVAQSLLPEDTVNVELTEESDGTRTLRAEL